MQNFTIGRSRESILQIAEDKEPSGHEPKLDTLETRTAHCSHPMHQRNFCHRGKRSYFSVNVNIQRD